MKEITQDFFIELIDNSHDLRFSSNISLGLWNIN